MSEMLSRRISAAETLQVYIDAISLSPSADWDVIGLCHMILCLSAPPARTDIPGGLPSPVSPHVPSLVAETQAATQRGECRQAAGGRSSRSGVDAVQRPTNRYPHDQEWAYSSLLSSLQLPGLNISLTFANMTV